MNYSLQCVLESANWIGRKILLIEESREVAQIVSKWFSLHGVEVYVSATGPEAFRLMLRADFDAVICNVAMRRLPAENLYIAVGKMKPHLLNRFVFLVGYEEKDDATGLMWKYCGPTVPMPLCLNVLAEAVESLLPQATSRPFERVHLAAA